MNQANESLERLFSTIKNMAWTEGRATTHGPAFDIAANPITNESFDVAEQQLGIPLPRLMRRLYTEIGNGGFGPGHGLLSMAPLSTHDVPIPQHYTRLRDQGMRNGFEWPVEVAPFNNWGDMIFSCIDTVSHVEDPPVLRFEPNMSKLDTIDFLNGLAFRGTGLIPECESLSQWLEDWVTGKEMFNRPYRR